MNTVTIEDLENFLSTFHHYLEEKKIDFCEIKIQRKPPQGKEDFILGYRRRKVIVEDLSDLNFKFMFDTGKWIDFEEYKEKGFLFDEA